MYGYIYFSYVSAYDSRRRETLGRKCLYPIEIITTSEVGCNVTKRDSFRIRISDISRYETIYRRPSILLLRSPMGEGNRFSSRKKKKKISSIYLSIYLRLINGVVSRNKGVVVELSQSLLIVLQATRKISKCGYLFVAPGWDFSNPLNRTKVRKILGPIENLYPPAFHHAQWLYAVYTR